MTSIRTYSELVTLSAFEDRFNYLKLGGIVGKETFGFDRYINQTLYRSEEWRSVRNHVILRDSGCDLGCEGFELHGRILVHHMNPITIDDIVARDPKVFDPEFLISCSHNTHNAIHYGDSNLLVIAPVVRSKNDTCPWKQNRKEG